jgi:hypothetical protein
MGDGLSGGISGMGLSIGLGARAANLSSSPGRLV